jgi:hypothetical protein
VTEEQSKTANTVIFGVFCLGMLGVYAWFSWSGWRATRHVQEQLLTSAARRASEEQEAADGQV